ncbi:molybdopterin molybdenumtransferase MoeA [Zhengella mangrovi]|uniref:Molybdopterin molybdenumtransferase n=1 Tax=Zhengella mangrovi TaxID=1982044 RepID=A0A2G1QQK1_9HYPH|nr:gephyrin-like molybdotransferase Glp [Zhengella mangrovi]PHP67847.1 molybdopterin molybdenumtransferase MoeA [Zhengella mangrovi]
MALLPVEDALARLLDSAGTLGTEEVHIADAAGRVLAEDLRALRTQPPFPASAMDGYAVRAADIATVPAELRVIGESAAGHRFSGKVGAGECVRIFTGAPVPPGADTVLIQEDATVLGDGLIRANETEAEGRHVRREGLDFALGAVILPAGRRLDPAALSLAAAANHVRLSVARRPLVAILATGDELLPPGSEPGPDQIIASNSFGVAALATAAGAAVIDLGIARDDHGLIEAEINRARAAGADIIVTLGGASVGDHDLVRDVLAGAGMELDFWKIAMRPGKPLMVGRFGETRVLGLPGNPVSSLVCAHLFLKPLIAALCGTRDIADIRTAALASPMGPNGDRQDYVRAKCTPGDNEALTVAPFARQDSSMLSTLADANCLVIRRPGAPAAEAGETVSCLMLRQPGD